MQGAAHRATAPLRLAFRPMDEAAARAVLAWRYEPPYAFYNADPRSGEADVAALVDTRNHYYSVWDASGGLVAFRCFGPDARVPGGDYGADALDTGGGLRPDLTGRGLGLGVLEAGLTFGQRVFHPAAFRVTVAAFNRRALTVCEQAGSMPVQTFRRQPDGRAFVVLLRDAWLPD